MKSNSYRPATYKDIVILERSYGQARNLQQAFKDNDIPFHVNSRRLFRTDRSTTYIIVFTYS